MTDDLAYVSAAELARLIAGRAVSPVEVVDGVLDRIERSQPVLNAFITVCAEEARQAAREAEAAVMRGEKLGPLHGVPFAVKDLVNTAGVRTTFGSVALADNIPAADSPAVARLKAAGAILVGKTTTPEFGHKCFTSAPLFGRTANPWDLARTPGGSSGGAARRSRPAWRPWASAPTAAGRAASRRRAAVSSASSRRWAWCRTT